MQTGHVVRIVKSTRLTPSGHQIEPGQKREFNRTSAWPTVIATCRGVVRKAGVETAEITAFGISNQRETVVVWERKTGKPIHRAIGSGGPGGPPTPAVPK